MKPNLVAITLFLLLANPVLAAPQTPDEPKLWDKAPILKPLTLPPLQLDPIPQNIIAFIWKCYASWPTDLANAQRLCDEDEKYLKMDDSAPPGSVDPKIHARRLQKLALDQAHRDEIKAAKNHYILTIGTNNIGQMGLWGWPYLRVERVIDNSNVIVSFSNRAGYFWLEGFDASKLKEGQCVKLIGESIVATNRYNVLTGHEKESIQVIHPINLTGYYRAALTQRIIKLYP